MELRALGVLNGIELGFGVDFESEIENLLAVGIAVASESGIDLR